MSSMDKHAISEAQENKLNATITELLSTLISPLTSFDEMYRLVLDKARFLTASEHGFVSSINELTLAHVSNTLTQMKSEGCSINAAFYALPVGPNKLYEGLWGHSLNRREAFFTNNPSAHSASTGLPAGHIPLKNFLSVPVMFSGKLLGQIALANSSHDYSEEDIAMIKKLGELYAIVLHNRHHEEELRTNEEQFRSMVEAAPFPLLITDLSNHNVLYANPRATELLDIESGTFTEVSINACYVDHQQYEDHLEEISHSGSIREKEVKLRSIHGRDFWGIVSAVKVHWLDREVVMTVINDITVRKQMEDDLKALATRDYLTGLWNRRYFMEAGEQEYNRFLRHNRPFSIIFFDLDHFKIVNDTYGHSQGDQVLITTTNLVQREIRAIDIAARYGGEEFAVILPETGLAESTNVAERMRLALESYQYTVPGGTFSVTASFGVCEIIPGDSSFESLIARADKALYAAKNLGRNQVRQG